MKEALGLARGNSPARIFFLLIRREMTMRLRSRVFRIVTALMVVFTIVGLLFAQAQVNQVSLTHVGFLGSADALSAPFAAEASALGAQVTVSEIADEAAGEAQIGAGTLDALVGGSITNPIVTVETTLNPTIAAALNAVVRQGVLNNLLTQSGVDPAAVEAQVAAAGIGLRSLKPVNPDRTQQILVGFGVAYMLMFSLSFYGGLVAQGVIEEKSTRIVEIVLSSVRPSQLLAGKIVGIGLVGLIQIAIIGVTGFAMLSLTHLIAIPAVSPGALAIDLLWFVLGFYLYAAMFAAGASLVSRQEEVASVTAPPISLLILAYLLVYSVVSNPSSPMSTVLSLLPPFAPVLMTFRMAMDAAPVWQVGLAMVLTGVTALGLTALAGRIYANSVLRVGSRVSLRDALGRR